jgi:uncharacterized peroxidase-related enzyme
MFGVSSEPLGVSQEKLMSRIEAIDPATTTGHVKNMLDGVQRGLGVLPNMFRVAAQSPAALEALTGLFGALSEGRLPGKAREAVALTVSELDRCDYCLSAHTVLGRGAGLSESELESARSAVAEDPRLRATLRLARAIVDKRGQVDDQELLEVRRAGLSEAEIVEVVANVALTIFTNYLNEVAKTEIDFPVVHHHPR